MSANLMLVELASDRVYEIPDTAGVGSTHEIRAAADEGPVIWVRADTGEWEQRSVRVPRRALGFGQTTDAAR